MNKFQNRCLCLIIFILIVPAISVAISAKPELSFAQDKALLFCSNLEELKPNSIYMQARPREKETLTIDIMAYDLSLPVFSFAINLFYDPLILKYIEYQKGNFLEKDVNIKKAGQPTYMIGLQDGSSEGKLIIGVSLKRGSPGVTGKGRIITLKFKMNSPGETTLIFQKNKAIDKNLNELADIIWYSGVIMANEEKKLGPTITYVTAHPSQIPNDGKTISLISAHITDADGIKSASLDLSLFGLNTNQSLYDDGAHGDQKAKDNIYSCQITASQSVPPKIYNLMITATDNYNNQTENVYVTLSVINSKSYLKIIIYILAGLGFLSLILFILKNKKFRINPSS